MTPPEPGGSAASIFFPIPLSSRCLANLPATPPSAAPTAVAASRGGAKRPTTSPTPPPILTPLRPRWSPVSDTCTSPPSSFWTRTTPSTVIVFSSASFSTASKSFFARSSNRYAAITTSLCSSLIARSFLRVDRVPGERLVEMLVQLLLMLSGQVRIDVEDDLLDLAGERERRLVGVAAIHRQAVVAADVHARVAGEADGDGVLHATASDPLVVDVQGHLAARCRLGRVGGELHSHVDAPGRQPRLRLLLELEHAYEGVGVLQLAVLDEEREAAQMVGLGHDHAFGAAFRNLELCTDRVGVVEDLRDHSGGDVLDVPVEGELGLRRQWRRHPEEGGEPSEQRQHVVLLGLLPEQLLELLNLVRVLLGQVVRLAEVVR